MQWSVHAHAGVPQSLACILITSTIQQIMSVQHRAVRPLFAMSAQEQDQAACCVQDRAVGNHTLPIRSTQVDSIRPQQQTQRCRNEQGPADDSRAAYGHSQGHKEAGIPTHMTAQTTVSCFSPEDTKEHVCIEGPFVRLVHDDDRVPVQIVTAERLAEHHTIGHILDDCLFGGAVLKADGVADLGEGGDRKRRRQRQPDWVVGNISSGSAGITSSWCTHD